MSTRLERFDASPFHGREFRARDLDGNRVSLAPIAWNLARTLGLLAALACAGGCAGEKIIGPLAHEQDERNHLFERARQADISTDLLNKVVPPLTEEELATAENQTNSCRSSYNWKNILTYTGSGLVAGAAGITIGGAYATGNTDTAKQVFGVTGGTMALFGSMLVAIGGIVANHYEDLGCTTRLNIKK